MITVNITIDDAQHRVDIQESTPITYDSLDNTLIVLEDLVNSAHQRARAAVSA